MDYYFFASTLPTLSMSAPPPLTVQRFRALCRDYLRAGDLERMESLLSGRTAATQGGGSFEAGWRRSETALRNAVARQRASRRKLDASPYLRETPGVDVRLEKAVGDAFGRPHPRERELDLDRLRWNLLDEQGGVNPFSIDAILAYGLKVCILERWAAMDAARGRDRVNEWMDKAPAFDAAAQPAADAG